MYTIYQLTNQINSKRYIGFTTKSIPEKRFNEHVNSANCGGTTYLHKAIRKYGSKNFIFEILAQGENDYDGLHVAEPSFIKRINPEYNLTAGGEGTLGFRHDKVSLMKISSAHKGKSVSEETRKRLSLAGMGKSFSESHKKALSLAMKGKTLPARSEDHKKKLSLSRKKNKLCRPSTLG